MTREEATKRLRGILTEAVEFENSVCYVTEEDREPLEMAIQALEQEPCDVFDEYGNYKYPSDVELTEPNTATSMPCEDAVSRQAALKIIDGWYENNRDTKNIEDLIILITYMVSVTPKPKTDWIPVNEKMPEDFGLYLITLENGDVCQCEFNPDFIDEEHENGAFTYYHQYFDGATLGMIDEEEEAVDAIAWMPFEPYEPQESEEV